MANFEPTKIPFFAASDLLPAPLPTIETITNSPDLVPESTGRRIVRVGPHFLVKFGFHVSLMEGENMLFVEQFPTISIPKVYAIYSDQNTRVNYIVMEYVEGRTLASAWDTLATSEKVVIADRLRDVFDFLRNLPSPGYFGSLGNRALEDTMFWTADDATTPVSMALSKQRLNSTRP